MLEKKIKMLRDQMDKMESNDFEINAWKNSTILVLERIFGKDNQKIRQIENIKFDLGSWSLRDTLAVSSNSDKCKRNGREILEACINELENLGLPEEDIKMKEEGSTIPVYNIISAFENELKVTQLRDIKEIIELKLKNEEKGKKIIDQLKKYGSFVAYNIVANILMNKEISSKL